MNDFNDNAIRKRCEDLAKLFQAAPIATHLGMTIRFDEKFRAIFELPYTGRMNNGIGTIHGGAIATLIDNAAWFTIAARQEGWIATVEMQIRMLEPVRGEAIWSRGKIIRLGKRLSTAEAEVRTSDNRLIAKGSGTFTTTSVEFDPETLVGSVEELGDTQKISLPSRK